MKNDLSIRLFLDRERWIVVIVSGANGLRFVAAPFHSAESRGYGEKIVESRNTAIVSVVW